MKEAKAENIKKAVRNITLIPPIYPTRMSNQRLTKHIVLQDLEIVRLTPFQFYFG